MFDKVKFANIIKNIKETYNSQEEFSKKSGIGRTYISQYMNMKLEEPPKPKILHKLSLASKGITTYDELMNICGYTNSNLLEVESLKEFCEQLEENFLDMLLSIKLSRTEEEVYEDLCPIIDVYSYENNSEDETKEKLSAYFNNMDFLSKKSKDKILKKLLFFTQYCIQMKNLRHKISYMKYSESDSNITLKLDKRYRSYRCPVYGRIAAGQPNWAEECIEGYLPIDPELMNITNPEECFFLRVNGESMNKKVKNGAYALIQKTDFVENGEIAVVLVNRFWCNTKEIHKTRRLNYIRAYEYRFIFWNTSIW